MSKSGPEIFPSLDQLVAKLALRKAVTSAERINDCIELQKTYRKSGKKLSLDAVMVAQGVLTREQADQLLSSEKITQLSCPRCDIRYQALGYDPDHTHTCKKCDGVLEVSAGKPGGKKPSVQVKPGDGAGSAAPGGSRRSSQKLPAEAARAGAEAGADSQIVAREDVLGAAAPTSSTVTADAEEQIDVQPPQEKTDSLCGTTVGGYKILAKLGQGGMGVIYKAEQLSLNRKVALKMLNQRLAEDETYLTRFLDEARAVAKLNHPHLIQIYDVGEDAGRYYFSMEYVEGESLGNVLDRIKLITPRQALDIVIQVTRALCAAHENRIVHRDIKPDNVMLTRAGVAKLADLGIAKTEEKGDRRQTETGVQMGTPYYISPEQAADPTRVDIRADIYSLGATFFHLVTGRTPYTGSTPAVIYMKLAKEPTPDATDLNPGVPYALNRLIKKMMAKSPAQRFSDPPALLAALQALEAELKDTKAKKRPSIIAPRDRIVIAAPTAAKNADLDLQESSPAGEAEIGIVPPSPGVPLPDVAPDEKPRGGARATSRAAPAAASPASTTADRLFSGVHKKPKDLPKKKTHLIVIAVLVGIAAIVGLVQVFSGKKKHPAATPGDKTATKGGPGKQEPGPKGPGKQDDGKPLTPQEKKEKEARELWEDVRLADLQLVDKQELQRIEAVLARIVAEFKGTPPVGPATQRQQQLAREKERREWLPVEKGAQEALAQKDYQKAEQHLTGFTKGRPPGHTQMEKAQNQLQALREKARNEADEALRKAGELREKGQLQQAVEGLAQAITGQLPQHQERLKTRHAALSTELANFRLAEQVRLHEPYFKQLSVQLGKQHYKEALAFAEKELAGPLGQAVPKEAELEDLRALEAGWRKLQEALKALEGKDTTLQFVGEKAAGNVSVVQIRGTQIVLKASIKRFEQLHRASLASLAGLDAGKGLERLRLGFLLFTLHRTEEAQDEIEAARSDPAFARFELRLVSWRLTRIRELFEQKNKQHKEWMEIYKNLWHLQEDHKGSPYLEATAKERAQWVERARNNVGVEAPQMVNRAKAAQKARKREEARLYCRIVVAFYKQNAEAVGQAQLILKELEGK